jgi:hypothetical protein
MSLRATFELYNPFRSPAWRFERVLSLVSRRPAPERASRSDDRYIRAYRKFLTQLEGRETRDSQMEIFGSDPALYFAHLLHHNPDKEYRTWVQARILAGQTDTEIARKCWGTLPATVSWYNKLFFDVRDRLDCKDYIDKVVVGRWDDRQSNPDGSTTFYQKSMMVKMFAFYGGPIILDYLVRSLKGLGRAWKEADGDGYVDKGFMRETRGRSATMMHDFPFNKFTVTELFNLHGKFIEMEKQAQMASGGAPADYHRNAEAMLKQIPWRFGQKGFKDKSELELMYDNTAVEPRADEALQLAAGVAPVSLEEIKDLELRLAEEK